MYLPTFSLLPCSWFASAHVFSHTEPPASRVLDALFTEINKRSLPIFAAWDDKSVMPYMPTAMRLLFLAYSV